MTVIPNGPMILMIVSDVMIEIEIVNGDDNVVSINVRLEVSIVVQVLR